jgi:hypothetical protein
LIHRSEIPAAVAAAVGDEGSGTDNDSLLAQMLQQEFDRENDMMLKHQEDAFNGSSKGVLHAYFFHSAMCA